MSSDKNRNLSSEIEEVFSELAIKLTQDTSEARGLIENLIKLSVDAPDFESSVKVILYSKYFELGSKGPQRDLAMIELLAASHLLVKAKRARLIE
jgi:hypothetical protein